MPKLKDFCEIKTNFEGADFWLVRKGQVERVGEVTKEYDPEYIGIKVTRTDVLLPQYLYYAMMNLQKQRYWYERANGVLELQHITVEDVKHIGLG